MNTPFGGIKVASNMVSFASMYWVGISPASAKFRKIFELRSASDYWQEMIYSQALYLASSHWDGIEPRSEIAPHQLLQEPISGFSMSRSWLRQTRIAKLG